MSKEKTMTSYRKSMMEALEEVYLNEVKMKPVQIAALKKAYEPMRGKRISPDNALKLQGIMDKVSGDKEGLVQLAKADIPFVSMAAVTRLMSKHNVSPAEIKKMKEEYFLESIDLDEMGIMTSSPPMS